MKTLVLISLAIVADLVIYAKRAVTKDSGKPFLLAIIAYLLWKKS